MENVSSFLELSYEKFTEQALTFKSNSQSETCFKYLKS